MKKKVLLTGGSGFIGRNLTEALKDHYDLAAPTRQELNLLDHDSVPNYFKTRQFDAVVHGATTPGHRNAKASVPVFESNLQMFFNLIAQRDRLGKFINLGSGSEYDMRHYQPKMKEEYFGEHIPVDPAGFSKYIISRFLEKDLSAVNLRLFGVFGKYEDYEIRFISNAICKTLFDRPITIKQNRKFDYLYIEDLGPVIRHFIDNESSFRVYNVTGDRSVDLKTYAELVRKVAGKNAHPIEIATPGTGAEYSGDNSRLRHEIPTLALTPAENAIERLYRWYSEQRSGLHAEALLVDK